MSESARPAAKAPAPSPVAAEALTRFVRDIFVRSGMAEPHAATVAEVLVWANLRGVDGHGVVRLPRYVELIEIGDMNPKPAMALRNETAASVLIEADRAPGPVAMSHAMDIAVRKSKDVGIGFALVRATTHTAALGYYTLAAARQGAAAIAFSASWANMAYHGARAVGVSTNPVSIAVPGEPEPVMLDMATSVVSMGKLNQARKTGQPIPAGWALDKNGNPTTDPKTAEIVLPMGGPKGSGLSFMIECLTSLIAGNPLISEFIEKTELGARHRQNALIIAIDIARFGDPKVFARELARLAKLLKALPCDPEVEEILLPGERAGRTYARRSRDGIPLPAATLAELNAVGERLGVSPLLRQL